MQVKPKVRGFICTTAHPQGCEANIMQAIKEIERAKPAATQGPKRVLIIGGSTGYGLASRLMAAFGYDAQTIAVSFERPATEKKTATAGWYNTFAFEKYANQKGRHWSINGDAFSHAIKQQVIELIQQQWPEGVDLVIYSIASPRRTDPDSGEVYQSCLKTLEAPYHSKSVNIHTGDMTQVTLDPATEAEVEATVKVMGGEDWQLWIEALLKANCLAPHALTLAYSYIGSELTHPMYRSGTIGTAKKHLEQTAQHLNKLLEQNIQGHAYVSVNKAVVTQAAAAIPVIPLYCAILYKVMQEQNVHEGCVEQMIRLFKDKIYSEQGVVLDDNDLIRMDDYEMQEAIQQQVVERFANINADNLAELADLKIYREDFMKLFGFERDDIDYDNDVDIALNIPSINDINNA